MITLKKKKMSRAALVAAAAIGLASGAARAGDTYLQVASGDWFSAGSWSAGVPDATTRALVFNGGTVTVGAPGAVAQSFSLASSAAQSSGRVVVANGGELTLQDQSTVGYYKPGYVDIQGGSLTLVDPDARLQLGFNAAGSGTVTHDSGNVTAGFVIVGYSGTGAYHMAGGNLTCRGVNTSWETTVGLLAGSVGTFNQSGGAVDCTGRILYIGKAGRGTYNLAGGQLSSTKGITVAGTGYGRFNIDGGTTVVSSSGEFIVSRNENSTGEVAQASGVVDIGNLFYLGYDGFGRYTLNGGALTVRGDANIGFDDPAGRGEFILNGGTATFLGDKELYIARDLGTHGTLRVQSGVLDGSSDVRMNVGVLGTGILEVSGGVITNLQNLYAAYNPGSTGQIVQTGGEIHLTGITSFGREADCTYRLSGGLLRLTSGGTEKWGGDTAKIGACRFYQTGGTVYRPSEGTERDLQIGQTAGSIGLLEISGGAFNCPNALIRLWCPGSCLRIVGGAPAITISRFYNDSNPAARTEFLLDSVSNHIAAVRCESTANRVSGTLVVRPRGGVLLAKSNAFELINVAGGTSYDYGTKPAAQLWNCAWALNVYGTRDVYRATLATGGGSWNFGTADLNGTAALDVTDANVGYVRVTNIDTRGEFRGMLVRMNVTPGAGGLAALIAYMRETGYTVATDPSGAYELLVSIAGNGVRDGRVGASYFIWDLSDFDATATVDALRFEEDRPKGTTIVVR